MVSAPPGARGLLTLLLLLPLPGARGQCGALPMLSHAVPHAVRRVVRRDTSRTEGFPINTEVTYRCRDGFVKIPGKSDTVVCLANSEWSTNGEFCSRGCGAPPRLKSAALNKEDEIKNYCPPGTNVSYVCRPGYERTELKLVITCLENLTWSEAPEFCRGKSCGVPKGPEHGRAVDITNDLYGARVNIICDEGFRLRGRTFIQCLPKGDQVEWSQLPTCQAITCSPPPYIANGMHNGSNVEIFEYSSSVTYKCDDNFSLTGESSIHCTTKDNINAVWNGSAPECKVICDSPPRLSFAELPGVVNNSYPVGTELKYSCRPGYILGSGKSPFATCLANSTWSVDPEFCVGRPCKPLELGNGRVDLTDLRFGATANFSCNEGYRLIGTTSAQCTLVGNGVDWDKELPLCQAIPCLPPPDITHGSHTGQSEQEFFFGSAVTYKCDQGFSLIGEASIHCTTKDNVNGEWSGPAPECKGLCGTLPRFSHAVPRDTNHTEGFPVDTQVTYRCRDGFVKIPGKSDTVVCLSTSEWSTIEEFCGPITCSSPPNIANGMHNGSNVEIFVYNSSVTYKCDDSFSLTGEASIHCTMKDNINGVWNGSAPECKVIIIQDKPTPVHRKGAEGAGTSSGSALNTAGNSAEPEGGGPGIDTHIGVIIGVIIIGIIIGIGIIGNNIGMFAALNKKWQKKKGSYSVNPDSSKHQNTTEHDFHINESKCNLIFKV